MIKKGPTVYETAYDLLKEELRGVLCAVIDPETGAGDGMGSVSWRACAALYSLVEGHRVDRRGRCRSCRRPGAVLGWVRRRCQVRVAACYWLQQPDETLLLALMARELNQHPAPSAGAAERADRFGSDRAAPAAGLDITEVLARIDLDRDDLCPLAPTVPRPPLAGGGHASGGWSVPLP